MKRNNRLLISILLLTFVLQLISFDNVKAVEEEKNIILLIDNSGSMQKTDPKKLSIAAASMLIDTIDSNTNLNIIAFGDKPVYSYKLLGKPSKENLKSQLSNMKFDNQNTNLKDGVKEALNQLEGVQGEKIIIVLSDGKEDIKGINLDEHNKEFEALKKQAQEMKVKIHSIGLSSGADKKALSEIANKTGGDYFYSENASGLFDVFSKILGNINGFYTIEQLITNSKTEKTIKLSPYIEEVIVKVASCQDNFPLVDVTFDTDLKPDYIAENRYKIYRFKNSESTTIKINSLDEKSNSVIVQVKSKAHININTSSDSFEIPYKVPLGIEMSLDIDKDINGLHMYKLEGGSKEIVQKDNNKFRFTFSKDKPGNHSVFITACDGNDNIVAAKYFNINVTDYTPFKYTNSLPEAIFTGRSFKLELSQQDDTKIKSASGEIHVKYEDKEEVFPLKFVNGVLSGDINLKNTGKVKISAQIIGIKDKDEEQFSYFLPFLNAEVLQSPYIEFHSVSYNKPFKEKEPVELKLAVNNKKIYQDEKIKLYDSNNKYLTDFVVKPKDSMVIVKLQGLQKGSNIKFILKAERESDIKITDEINTNLRIISNGQYFLYKYRIILISFVTIIVLIVIFILVCLSKYKNYVEPYNINKQIECFITPNGYRGTENIALSTEAKRIYLNIINSNIDASTEEAMDCIGCFSLKAPKGSPIIQGLEYLLKGEKVFEVIYSAAMEQEDSNGNPIADMPYKPGEEIQLKMGRKIIKIYLF